jgi:diaminohydroxyphosphoribosylaminopyrimidine deaminase/5-amino-6-(5-phosphoribosylamino)uracil reductase
VYVEGGPTLASAVIAAGYADEYAIYLAPALLGGPKLAIGELGIPSMDAIRRLHIDSVEQLGDDLYLHAVVSTREPSARYSTTEIEEK